MKQPYITAHPYSFRKAFSRITERNMTRHTIGLRVRFHIDAKAVWRDVLTEFKLNRNCRKHIARISGVK